MHPKLHHTPSSQIITCQRILQKFNHDMKNDSVFDSQAAPVSGFPFLRVNRFLSSFRQQHLSHTQFQQWVQQMAHLANQARTIEWQNLPLKKRKPLQKYYPYLNYCSRLLEKVQLQTAANRYALTQNAVVPSDYIYWHRIVGLYPITQIPVVFAIGQYHKKRKLMFATPIAELAVKGRLVRYDSPTEKTILQSKVAKILQNSSRNPLQIPKPSKVELNLLFATYAPIWEIDVASINDEIGKIQWWPGYRYPVVNILKPTVYRKVSYMYYHDQILLQLNYIIWFPARPKTWAFSMSGGYLDGIDWRVTLLPSGKPLMYDSMHNCGCYHLYIISRQLRQRPSRASIDEKAFVPQYAPAWHAGEHVIIRIEHTTHYIQRAYIQRAYIHHQIQYSNSDVSLKTKTYQWANYTELRSMPLPTGGNKSLFLPNGLISGSMRNERIYLWPMGVPYPGAMRQWGHHATSFVGQSYFDDPYLITQNFY